MNIGLLFGVAIIFFILGLIAGLLVAGLRESPRKPEEDAGGGRIGDENSGVKTPEAQPDRGNNPSSWQEPAASTAASTGDVQTPAAESTASAQVQPISTSAISAIGRILSVKGPKPEQKPSSIAAQIDSVLQEKLSDSPFSGRGIRLIELPDHQIQVQVDSEKYAGIDAVPFEDVRSFIRQAVAEWEKRSSKS